MTLLGIIILLVAVALTVVVVMQEGKNNGLSGAIAGGSSDTFLGKSKAASKQKKLARVTAVLAVVFAALVLTMHIAGLSGDNYEYKEPTQTPGVTDVAGEDTTAADDTAAEDTTADTEGDEQ